MAGTFSLGWRLVILIIYVALVAGINQLLFGEMVPDESKLLISFISFLFANLIIQPHYTGLKDSMSNAAAAVFVIIPLLFGSGTIQGGSRSYWIIALIVAFAIAIMSSLVTVIDGAGWRRKMAETLFSLSSKLGKPKVLFSVLHFLILHTFYPEADDIFWLSLAWVVIVFGQPVEFIFGFARDSYRVWRALKNRVCVLGEVVSRHHPRLLTIRIDGDEHPPIDSLVLVPTSPSRYQVGVVLDNYRLDDELWTRALVLKDNVSNDEKHEISGPYNVALVCDEETEKQVFSEERDYKETFSKIMGAVKENSNLYLAQIELYRDALCLTEGQVVSIEFRGKPVLYQIINGVTKSEELEKSNRHGFMQVEARKMGLWDHEKKRLESVPWTPQIYSPVSKVSPKEFKFDERCIGFIPHTSYGIELNCKEIVTHNTAILGVLGSGKTSLAIELVRRMARKGIKVWIIDITGEYEIKLKDLISTSDIAGNQESVSDTRSQFKSRQQIRSQIQCFLKDTKHFVKITNLSELGTFSPTQFTRYLAEEILSCLRNKPSNEVPFCLVLEEAHSLVPEWNSTVERNEQYDTNATAKAIMQGRKYGYGCLLVTQRTANVTKSILNQCNTMFALQIFDDTGKDFLQNYFGEEYASMLPALQSRHCVAYGRGLKTKTPVLIELNGSKEVRKHFGVPEEPTAATDT